MKEWGDGKRFIAENIVLSSLGLVGSIGLDGFRNLLFYIGLNSHAVPFSVGIFQVIGAGVSAVFLIRALVAARYYF